jgi:hypothetical protein
MALGIYLNAAEVLSKNVTHSKAVLLLDKERRQKDRFEQDSQLDLSGDSEEVDRKKFRVNNSDVVADDTKFDDEDNKATAKVTLMRNSSVNLRFRLKDRRNLILLRIKSNTVTQTLNLKLLSTKNLLNRARLTMIIK